MGIIGYARVSTDGQSVDGQIAELKATGAVRVYQEKVLGATSDRAALKRARGFRPGGRRPSRDAAGSPRPHHA